MRISTYGNNEGDIQTNANVVKEMVLTQLAKDGHINNPIELSEEYAVVVVKKGWLGRMIDKYFFRDGEKDVVKLAIVKVCK